MSPFQAILLNQVIVGVSKHLQMNADYLKRPPEGYDSVRACIPSSCMLTRDVYRLLVKLG